MEQGNKILFWFRESFALDNSEVLCNAINDYAEVIPVFCFDPREQELIKGLYASSDLINDQIRKAQLLRKELQLHGSNLLVVNHPYEKIIPSLARVLKVTKVVTNQLVDPETVSCPELSSFRNQKAREISYLLNLHSIPVIFEKNSSHNYKLPLSLPGFPEINPGLIPY